ncbi:hypothetical protein GQ54DRAFT_305089 [Martensiomyces pterosporus]|nr:hypothetical protein GQ54DRAFT_305089 [Martensiomyces pterosporus]
MSLNNRQSSGNGAESRSSEETAVDNFDTIARTPEDAHDAIQGLRFLSFSPMDYWNAIWTLKETIESIDIRIRRYYVLFPCANAYCISKAAFFCVSVTCTGHLHSEALQWCNSTLLVRQASTASYVQLRALSRRLQRDKASLRSLPKLTSLAVKCGSISSAGQAPFVQYSDTRLAGNITPRSYLALR